MARSQVLSLYRKLLRSAKFFPTPQGRANIPIRIRDGFRSNVASSNPQEIGHLLMTAEAHLLYLQLKETRNPFVIPTDPSIVPVREESLEDETRWTLNYIDLVDSIMPNVGYQYYLATQKPGYKVSDLEWPPGSKAKKPNAHIFARERDHHRANINLVDDLHADYHELPLSDFSLLKEHIPSSLSDTTVEEQKEREYEASVRDFFENTLGLKEGNDAAFHEDLRVEQQKALEEFMASHGRDLDHVDDKWNMPS